MKYYGLLSARFCQKHKKWRDMYEEAFEVQYQLCHRLETNKLRNIAKLFAFLLAQDAVSWQVGWGWMGERGGGEWCGCRWVPVGAGGRGMGLGVDRIGGGTME